MPTNHNHNRTKHTTGNGEIITLSELLSGWTVEERSFGVGQCFGGCGKCLCSGKWGIIGTTGKFRILHPNGWIEDCPVFKTEIEAMQWVLKQDNDKVS